MVLDALFCVGPAVAELSPSTSRTFIPLLSSYRAIVQVEMRSSCAHGSQCPFWRWTAAAAVHSPVHIGRFYRSCHRAGRLFKSRCALIAFTMPFFGVRTPPLLCSRRPHRTFVSLSPLCKAIVQVEMRSKRLWFLMPSLASDRRRRCALAVHIGRSYRSRHRARRDRSRRDALVVCSWFSMPSLASDPAVAVLSTSTICLYRLPSCRAIIQVETRSYCVHGARCPSLASGRRRCCALAVHIGRLYRALAIMQGDRSSRDALDALSWFSMPSLASDRRRRCALAVPIGRLYRFCH